MSVKFTSDLTSEAFINLNRWSFYTQFSFLWGKATRTENGDFLGIQEPMSCKDYVVDTYFNTYTGGFRYKDKYKDAIYSPHFYIVCPTKTLKKQILCRIKSHVNEYEKKHGFIPTVAYDVECDFNREGFNDRFICFEYDPKWMINSTAMSVYLSMVRCFIYSNQDTAFSTIKFEKVRGCNEYTYYSNLGVNEKHLISYLYNNPNLLIVDTTKFGYTKSGFKKDTGHGASGLFFSLKQISNENYYPYNTWRKVKTNCCDNWFYNILHQWVTGYTFLKFFNHPNPVTAGLTNTVNSRCEINTDAGYTKLLEHLTNGGVFEYVEPVQSVQQKVVRKRTVKKVPKQGTEGMLLGAM